MRKIVLGLIILLVIVGGFFKWKQYKKSVDTTNAFLFYEAGEYSKAQEYFEKAILAGEEGLALYRSYAFTLYALEEYDKAETVYVTLLNKKPNDREFLVALGNIAMFKNDLDNAEKRAKDVLASYPNDSRAYFLLADVYRARKDIEQALKYNKMALSIMPTIKPEPFEAWLQPFIQEIELLILKGDKATASIKIKEIEEVIEKFKSKITEKSIYDEIEKYKKQLA